MRRLPRYRIAAVGIALLILAGVAAPTQDLSTFLASPPGVGSWARYDVTTVRGGRRKVRPFRISVTGQREVSGRRYLWLEAWPYKFKDCPDGTLRMLVKEKPEPEESLNPFLQAVSLAYREPGEDPFRLSEGALNLLRSRARKVHIDQEMIASGPASLEGAEDDCLKECRRTTIRTRLLGRDHHVEETGCYWLSEKVPFRILRAEIDRLERKGRREKRKQITIVYREGGIDGAASRFEEPVKKVKGIWSLLLGHGTP